ncbi:MAG: hypothetical protein KAH84_12125 [Thiomargarita sp.]|nr:hypothetical protein [Thiomargarita sp.]
MKISHIIIVTILSLTAGCSLFQTAPSNQLQIGDRVVWANDGSDVALVKLENQAGEYKHQIIIKSPTNHEISNTITGWRLHQTGQLFYMKQAGYLVVESFLENGARRFDKIDLNGNEILIVETPNNQICKDAIAKENAAQVYQTVIPSPDGTQLAHIYSPQCGQATVEFLHANNLSLFDNQTIDIIAPMKAQWHPDNYLLLIGSNQTWKITPLMPPPTQISSPICGLPVTSSSNISAYGKEVVINDNQIIVKDVDIQKVFGCN